MVRRVLNGFLHLFLWLPLLAAAQQTGTYTVDSATSNIHWRIYSAGALSGVGHNHVISAGSISGTVEVKAPPGASGFSLVIPVSSLVVDDPDLRRRYGEAFAGRPSAKDITGTRENMLGPKLLKAAKYPKIRLRGGSPKAGRIRVTASIAGRRMPLTLPCKVSISGDLLVARGSFSLSHRQLGLTPLSAALGVLKVADRIDFNYVIRARRR